VKSVAPKLLNYTCRQLWKPICDFEKVPALGTQSGQIKAKIVSEYPSFVRFTYFLKSFVSFSSVSYNLVCILKKKLIVDLKISNIFVQLVPRLG
jgi:hypothetical protein